MTTIVSGVIAAHRPSVALTAALMASLSATAAGCMGSSGSGAASSQAPAQVPAPDVSETDSPFRVRLSWTMPAGSRVDGFQVSRGGDVLARLPATATSFVDRDVSPPGYYVYSVEATQGPRHSQAGMVSAKLVTPPLTVARLEGYFNVRFKLVSASGYRNTPTQVRNEGWHFKPRCGHGACDVMWRNSAAKLLHARASRHGGQYHLTFHGFYYSTCGGAHATSAVEIVVHVTKAHVSHGTWIASRIQGSFDENEAQQLGCAASHYGAKVLGRATV